MYLFLKTSDNQIDNNNINMKKGGNLQNPLILNTELSYTNSIDNKSDNVNTIIKNINIINNNKNKNGNNNNYSKMSSTHNDNINDRINNSIMKLNKNSINNNINISINNSINNSINKSSKLLSSKNSSYINNIYNNGYNCYSGCSFHELSEEEKLESQRARKKLIYASIFCFLFMIAEFTGGSISHSLALMSDALHLFSDFASFMINIFALWMTTKGATDKLSFGYHRSEIVGALFSVFLIWGLTIWLVYEAIQRILHYQPIDGKIMFIVACCGITINIVMGYVMCISIYFWDSFLLHLWYV